jgi:nitronate monooxygenase
MSEQEAVQNMGISQSQQSSLHTLLCDRLGIRYPIIQAPMAGGWTTPELVAAVSNAGGLGVYPASRLTDEQLRDAIHQIRALTNKPFGVNFQTAGTEPGNTDVAATQRLLDSVRAAMDLPPGPAELHVAPQQWNEQIQLVLDERVPVLSLALGDPAPFVAAAQACGAVVMAMITTVAEAQRAASGGVDILVAQGAEAGGHRSILDAASEGEVPLVGTLALVPQIVDAVNVPVAAAGGIADARGLVAALALGAEGVQIGTRFLLAAESGTPPSYRARLLGAIETDTVVTRAFTGRPARSLRNRFIERYEQGAGRPLAWPLQRAAAADIYAAAQSREDADYYPLLAGQALRLLNREQPAAEIVEELVREAAEVLERFRRLE